MDNRKEPPFFNDDNMGPYYYRLHFYDTMELFIETLTGTCFELRVSPFETIISVKAKIRRLEVPTEDPLRKMAEYLDSSRVEVWEKTSCNKQVTFLVYREGDQLNFLPAVDRGNGTLTPLSDSSKKIGFHLHVLRRKGEHRMSGGSMYNSDTDEDEETEPSSGQQIIENSITMNKMKLLKAKMKNMNLSKKPKKAVKIKPHPPIAPRPSSGSTAPSRHRLSAHGVGMNGNNAATGKSVGECTTHHLPPVKAPLQAKKKKTNHCFLCGKKTGLASSYECRCGNNFCASHRYAETHGCTYDYKSAGRRYLHEANPVVNAPKLPKI